MHTVVSDNSACQVTPHSHSPSTSTSMYVSSENISPATLYIFLTGEGYPLNEGLSETPTDKKVSFYFTVDHVDKNG